MMKSYNNIEVELLKTTHIQSFLNKYNSLKIRNKKRFFKKYAKKIPCILYDFKNNNTIKNISVHDISSYNSLFNAFIINFPDFDKYNLVKHIYQLDFDIIKDIVGLDMNHILIYHGIGNGKCLEFILDCSEVKNALRVDLLKIKIDYSKLYVSLCDIYGNIHKQCNVNNIEERVREAKLKYIEEYGK